MLPTSALSAQTHTLVLVAAGLRGVHDGRAEGYPRRPYLADSVLGIGRIRYDRADQTDEQFARVLVDNALRRHADEVVLLVVESRLAPVVVREASGLETRANRTSRRTSVYVITVTPKYTSVVSLPR